MRRPARDSRDDDPRPVSDHRVREKHSEEEIRRWRQEAENHHRGWYDVMNNPYGKD